MLLTSAVTGDIGFGPLARASSVIRKLLVWRYVDTVEILFLLL